MDTTNNRARVILRPLDDSAPKNPPGFTLLAIMDAPRAGWLARIDATGRLVCYTGTGVASVDERKAGSAYATLAAMPDETDPPTAAEIAATVRAWRADRPVVVAAALLGLPARTFESIEQGRGFRYPRLLALAMSAVG